MESSISVWSVAKLLEDTGALTEEEVKQAMPFCLSACARLAGRLKDQKFCNEPAVINACAGIALYDYALLKNSSSEDFSSFKAGDVTISRSPSSSFENAVRFRDASMLNATEFLTDVDFIFRTVDV